MYYRKMQDLTLMISSSRSVAEGHGFPTTLRLSRCATPQLLAYCEISTIVNIVKFRIGRPLKTNFLVGLAGSSQRRALVDRKWIQGWLVMIRLTLSEQVDVKRLVSSALAGDPGAALALAAPLAIPSQFTELFIANGDTPEAR